MEPPILKPVFDSHIDTTYPYLMLKNRNFANIPITDNIPQCGM